MLYKLSQLEREKQVMVIKQELAEHTMALLQQQNATASTSPKRREAPIQRLLVLKSPIGKDKNVMSKPPGGIKLATAPLGSKQIATAPNMENDQRSNASACEQTMAHPQQQNGTTASPKREASILRLSRDPPAAMSARNLKKSPRGEKTNMVSKPLGTMELAAATTSADLFKSLLGKRKNAVSKPLGSIEFAAAMTSTNLLKSPFGGNKKAVYQSLQEKRFCCCSILGE
jgi:hypothetical protein